MSVDVDLPFLRALPYFRGLSNDELAIIAARCRQRALDDDEIIMMEGQPAAGLYVVREGRVRIFKTSSRGKEQVLIVLGPGETFNDVPVFDGGPNPAGAQAAAPGTTVYIVPTAVVMELLISNPRVAADIIHILAGRLRHLTAVVEDLSFHHITERVAKLLLAESAADSRPLLTQERMATRIGTAREVVSRALRTLEQQGAITRQRNRIVAINAPLLRALLERGASPEPDDRAIGHSPDGNRPRSSEVPS